MDNEKVRKKMVELQEKIGYQFSDINLLSDAMKSERIKDCDFLIYNKLNKEIEMVVEVDGSQHKEDVQAARDKRKDRLLKAAGIKILRLPTMKRKPDKSPTSFLYAIVGRSSDNFLFLTKER